MAATTDPSILGIENTDSIVSGTEMGPFDGVSGARDIKYRLTVRLTADDAAAADFYDELVRMVSGCASAEVAGYGFSSTYALTASVDHDGFVTWTLTENGTSRFGLVSANRLVLLVSTIKDVDDPTFEADLETMRSQLGAP